MTTLSCDFPLYGRTGNLNLVISLVNLPLATGVSTSSRTCFLHISDMIDQVGLVK